MTAIIGRFGYPSCSHPPPTPEPMSAPTEAKPAQPDCSGGMPCTDCPNKRKCQAGCMRQEEALERPNREEPSQRHPLDVEALHELQKVMADFGGDWPDVPGEQEVVRRAKMLSRLWKADRLVGSERIEAAAKVLAASMCYQWDSMLEEDRDTMRKTAEAIIRAATAAQHVQRYAQQALELCDVCGWKTLIPDDGCLNCERKPLTDERDARIAELECQLAEALEASLGEPVAWRYKDSRGHYRYCGYKTGFDTEHSLLKPIPLYALTKDKP